MIKNKEKEFFILPLEVNMMENGKMIIFKEKEFIIMLKEINIRENG
jgi:hypothetical protein